MPLVYEWYDRVAITGHRVFPDPGGLYRGLDRLRAREYYFGGARGVDTKALQYISRTQPSSIRTVVVPNRLINQPVYARQIIKQHATRLIELKNTGPDRYFIRNRYIIDRSSHLRAFYDFRGKGGTLQGIEHARRTGKSFDVWPLQKFDKNEIMAMSENRFKHWMHTMRGLRVKLASIKGIIIQYMHNVGHTALAYWFPELAAQANPNLEAFW